MRKAFIVGALYSFILFSFFPTFVDKRAEVQAQSAISIEKAGKAECVMEKNSRRILYQFNGDQRLPMASTTKIATAITVLEHCDNIQEKMVIPQEAEGVEGSSVYLKSGDEYSVNDLLYGLMLRSGNDCATALALHCAGSVADFCAKMNDTAQRAGAIATRFKNPHGLPANGHYTTAQDLTAITCYAMQNPTFCQIVSTRYYEPCGWKNKNKLLFEYPECIGVKTGYTKEAGRCLVSAATQGEMTLVCSVLNCGDMYARSEKLLKDAFSAYEYVKLIDKTQMFALENKNVNGRVINDVYYPLMSEEKEWINFKVIPSNVKKSDEQGEIIGYIEIRLAKRLLFSENLYKIEK